MRLTRPSATTQWFLGTAVVSLLAANAVVAAATLWDGGSAGPSPTPVATSGQRAAVAEAPRTVMLITTRDGRQLVADPNTAEGRKAIDDARDEGGSVESLPLPETKDESDPSPLADRAGADSTTDLGRLLGGGGSSGVVEVGKSTFDQLLGGGGSTVTTVVNQVGSTPSTVTSLLGGAPATVTSILAGAPSTITSVLPTVPAPVTSIVNQLPVTTPPTSSLSGLVTTVTSVVHTVTSSVPVPTTAPATPGPVCSLLVHC